jgi:hypothetical protein
MSVTRVALITDLFSVLNIRHFQSKRRTSTHGGIDIRPFIVFRKPVVLNSVVSKKKEQEKFNEYSINTDDAWEIDERAMTLKILDGDSNHEDDGDSPAQLLGISKQVRRLKWRKK